MKYKEMERLIEIVSVLRSENGCEWDKEQTHQSLRPNMLEEAYEAVDAIDEGDVDNLREELGDVLLQVVLHAQIAKDNGEFDIEDVAKAMSDLINLYKDNKTPDENTLYECKLCLKTLVNSITALFPMKNIYPKIYKRLFEGEV